MGPSSSAQTLETAADSARWQASGHLQAEGGCCCQGPRGAPGPAGVLLLTQGAPFSLQKAGLPAQGVFTAPHSAAARLPATSEDHPHPRLLPSLSVLRRQVLLQQSPSLSGDAGDAGSLSDPAGLASGSTREPLASSVPVLGWIVSPPPRPPPAQKSSKLKS